MQQSSREPPKKRVPVPIPGGELWAESNRRTTATPTKKEHYQQQKQQRTNLLPSNHLINLHLPYYTYYLAYIFLPIYLALPSLLCPTSTCALPLACLPLARHDTTHASRPACPAHHDLPLAPPLPLALLLHHSDFTPTPVQTDAASLCHKPAEEPDQSLRGLPSEQRAALSARRNTVPLPQPRMPYNAILGG